MAYCCGDIMMGLILCSGNVLAGGLSEDSCAHGVLQFYSLGPDQTPKRGEGQVNGERLLMEKEKRAL